MTLHFTCPRDGRKLSKVTAYDGATTNTRRTCPGCHRVYVLTIQHIAIEATKDDPAGWALSVHQTEQARKTTVIE